MTTNRATENQRHDIITLADDKGYDLRGVNLYNMTKAEASAMIDELKAAPRRFYSQVALRIFNRYKLEGKAAQLIESIITDNDPRLGEARNTHMRIYMATSDDDYASESEVALGKYIDAIAASPVGDLRSKRKKDYRVFWIPSTVKTNQIWVCHAPGGVVTLAGRA